MNDLSGSSTALQSSGCEVRALGLTKLYGDFPAVQDVNLDVAQGEFLALLGRNGAGKTTLVKLLCGFYYPTKGRIFINGADVKKLSLKSYWKKLAVLFQDFEDYDFSARESIGYGNIEKINDLSVDRHGHGRYQRF